MPLFVFDGSQPAPGGGGVLSSDSQAVISDLQTIVLNDNGIGVSAHISQEISTEL